MWRLTEKPFVTFPDDLTHFEDYEENGLVYEALDRKCVKCWLPFDVVVWEPCAADAGDTRHLVGGVPTERAARSHPEPGTTAREVALRQAREKAARELREQRKKRKSLEPVALMQASRLDGLR
ncbi:hypothetical protein [Nonomuraea recticatena]|uniref:Uncharacterized protein n=1 Tax=Nonomuraea recticatena TaxID=46178 RepID=A0ABP6FJM9_9ACTN